MSVTAEVTWSTWGSWSSCTKTCGRGRSDRYRTCSEGSTCPGDQSEARWCNSNTCPGHHINCAVRLIRKDFRQNIIIKWLVNGLVVVSYYLDFNDINPISYWKQLKDVATWSAWGSWSQCTKTCGRGRSDRYRSCSGGSTCQGERGEAKWCNTNTCPGELRSWFCFLSLF